MSHLPSPKIVPSKQLRDYRFDRFSQSGEDGIIARVLEILPNLNRWCVEFGAWDGIYLSNTRRLILEEAYQAVLIEGSSQKFAKLKQTHGETPGVIPLNAMVGWGESDNLDSLLAATPIPLGFDVLSIDIDGNDYHVWAAVKRYRPKLVVIETNPTIPNAVSQVQPLDGSVVMGSSLRSMIDLGREKGYEPIAYSGVNAYFVRAEDFPLFGIPLQQAHDLRDESEMVTHLFFDFQGRAILSGSKRLLHHALAFDESRIRQIPRCFQEYPDSFGRLKAFFFWKVYRRLRYPRLSLLGLWNRVSRRLRGSR